MKKQKQQKVWKPGDHCWFHDNGWDCIKEGIIAGTCQVPQGSFKMYSVDTYYMTFDWYANEYILKPTNEDIIECGLYESEEEALKAVKVAAWNNLKYKTKQIADLRKELENGNKR